MRYAAFDPMVRETKLNEYLNIATGQPETIRYYGAYRVKETFLTPDGKILLLAHDPTGVQKFATGVHNGSLGRYWDNGTEARLDYVQRIAESFGLVVGPSGSALVRQSDRELLTQDAREVRYALNEWSACKYLDSPEEAEEAGDALEAKSTDLAKRLQRTGVLSETVCESWAGEY